MKYASKDQAFMIRGLTESERAQDDLLTVAEQQDAPQFYVKVSPVSRGWWTREEVTALRDKLNEALGE